MWLRVADALDTSQRPIALADRRRGAILQSLGISLIVGLAGLVFASLLTSSLPTWVGILALVAETRTLKGPLPFCANSFESG